MPALLAVMLVLAQSELPEHPVAEQRPYWDKCRAIWGRSPYVVNVGSPIYVPVRVGVPAGSGSTPSGSSGGGGSASGLGSGGGRPELLLVLAVALLAALPFIVYAVDAEADPLTLERFYCPEFTFSAMGGAQFPTGPGQTMGLGVAKVRADVGYLGVMAELGLMPSSSSISSAFSAHLLVRPPPKAHIEGALALGVRRAIGPGGAVDGVEVGLPHMYVFKRDGYKKLGLEVMPRVMFRRGGFDVGGDLTLAIPIADVVQGRIGGAAFSVMGQTQLTASVGLAVHL